jgi:hypothetical protein
MVTTCGGKDRMEGRRVGGNAGRSKGWSVAIVLPSFNWGGHSKKVSRGWFLAGVARIVS